MDVILYIPQKNAQKAALGFFNLNKVIATYKRFKFSKVGYPENKMSKSLLFQTFKYTAKQKTQSQTTNNHYVGIHAGIKLSISGS